MSSKIHAVDLFNKLAKSYQEKYMNIEAYSNTLDKFCNELDKGGKIFEFGCGPGNITRYLQNKRPDFQITASDLAPNMLELAKSNCSSVRFKQVDAKNLSDIKESYDGIVIGFILPYLSIREVETFFKDLVNILNPSGVIYLSTIERDIETVEVKTSSSGDSVEVNYYSLTKIKSILEVNGFSIIEFKSFKNNNDMELEIIAKLG